MYFDFEAHEARMDRLEAKALALGLSTGEAKEYRMSVSELVKARWLQNWFDLKKKQVEARREYEGNRPAPVFVECPPQSEQEIVERANQQCAMALFEHQTALICDCNCLPSYDINYRCPHLAQMLKAKENQPVSVASGV